ncbi:ATP dependent DNA ligase [Xylanimonas cellulosilytica DSM 15894]|uniref:DNA ligase (ATP) n=1 Tax=Xylanimonas cellulosilytica (strain DSM 15894 / JCM 12276 / CECT 5975 / KCTC 9989 / LMG 20990 / NBRC 107835 / XIL07) TaxID=446471 RepID=D1BSK5_XYLCX|nr:ATP-dependent DNA ligase [Xylanimonas cellulosilytica]ACZ30697.1 ATP dependent DNA ligase [Xylanimonas cellulosilytica DSM 15894]
MPLPLTPPILPMLARSAPSVPDQPDDPSTPGTATRAWVYEPKWDGFRAIVYRDGDDVRIDSRNARPMQRYFPEVVEAVLAALPERCVVDGEIVVAQPGDGAGDLRRAHLDFEVLSQRIHPAASRVRMLAESVPASLVVFDVLALDDADLTARPLRDRLAALDRLALTGPQVFATPRTTDAAVAREWFERFEGAGLDGVVAKPLDGAYQPDKRAMLKVKHARTADVVLAGYRLHKTSTADRPLIGSLLLGLHDDAGQLQFVGVAASFPASRRAALVEELASLVVQPGTPDHAAHPWGAWQDPAAGDGTAGERRPGAQSRWSAGKDLSFTPLRAERVLEVGYDHMEGTRFRHTAQFKRWRPDREPASCTFSQLEEPVGYDLASLLPGAPGTA